jgi:hypothetical protein
MILLKDFIIILATRRKTYFTLKKKKKKKKKKKGVLNFLSNKECSITSLGVLGSLDPFGFTILKHLI